MRCLRPVLRICLLVMVLLMLGCASSRPAQTPPVDAGATEDSPSPRGELMTFLAGSLSDEALATFRETAPNVRIIAGLSHEDALKLAPDVDGIEGRYCTSEFIDAAPELRWVQSGSAGVERYLAVPELRDNDRITLTNMQGVHGPTIADHVFGMVLTLTRDLRYYTDDAQQGTWDRSGSGADRIALKDRTLLVVGLGGIGREVAQRGKGFGMRVLATRRSAVPPPPYVDQQGTPDDLHTFLAEADVVVLCVPLTDETRGMIGVDELALLAPGSYLVNIARGPVVDTDALVEALTSGRLAGAGLDVTDPEPLPADHGLWELPNVIITPHVAGWSALTGTRREALYVENIRRFGAGEPLLNVVDKQAGY